MITKKFLQWIIIAIIVAWPLSWYAANQWLKNFSYRTDIHWWFFAASGGISLIIALITISFQTLKAARTNPVDSLRYG